jgi:protein-tyrosine phosphatase
VPTRLLFVCLGNICRSPTAEAVMRHVVAARGLEQEVVVDSAGTGAWHAGSPPDQRATAAARTRGITVQGAARKVTRADFEEFDLLLAMDDENLHDLLAVAPPDGRHKVRKLAAVDVPDPYYGGSDGFETVLDLVEEACVRLLDEVHPS